MTSDQHRELVAAVLASGLLAASPKPATASRAVREFREVLAELALLPPRSESPAAPPAPRHQSRRECRGCRAPRSITEHRHDRRNRPRYHGPDRLCSDPRGRGRELTRPNSDIVTPPMLRARAEAAVAEAYRAIPELMGRAVRERR